MLRVRVISVPFGGGHRSVAEAIGWRLSSRSPAAPADVVVLDGLEAVSRRIPLARLGAAFYYALTRPGIRRVYDLLFRAVDRWPSFVGRCCYAALGGRARQWLTEEKPDVVVSTFPFVTHVLGEAIADLRARTRLVTFVTDGGNVNGSWFSGRCDLFLVSDEEALEAGRARLSDATRVVCVPLPLRPGFDAPMSRAQARANLGINDEIAVLVWGGGHGLAHGMLDLAHAFRRQRGIVPLFVVGENRRLATRVAKAIRDIPSAEVFERYEDMPLLLSAVDLAMGKAGWVSLGEAAAAGVHTVCFDALPGQEEENLRVHMRLGSASWSPNVVDAVREVRRIIQVSERPVHARVGLPSSSDAALCAAILQRAFESQGVPA